MIYREMCCLYIRIRMKGFLGHEALLHRIPSVFLVLGVCYAALQLIGCVLMMNPPHWEEEQIRAKQLRRDHDGDGLSSSSAMDNERKMSVSRGKFKLGFSSKYQRLATVATDIPSSESQVDCVNDDQLCESTAINARMHTDSNSTRWSMVAASHPSPYHAGNSDVERVAMISTCENDSNNSKQTGVDGESGGKPSLKSSRVCDELSAPAVVMIDVSVLSVLYTVNVQVSNVIAYTYRYVFESAVHPYDWSIAQVLKNRTFWHIFVSFFLFVMYTYMHIGYPVPKPTRYNLLILSYSLYNATRRSNEYELYMVLYITYAGTCYLLVS